MGVNDAHDASTKLHCRVEFFAGLRERFGADALERVELEHGSTVADLKRVLLERWPRLGSLASVRAVLGTQYVRDETLLVDGATVHLLPPVSGGAERDEAPARGDDLEHGVFELVATPIDPGAAFARVAHPACGGTVVFSGSTRETNRDKSVTKLDYEAFERMCGPQMARIFEQCLALHGPPAGSAESAHERRLRMFVQHRTGVALVGETSVVVAVASPHRAAAFDAARFLIDELKRSLPVWKKECYADGHEWIGEGA
jgi:molybdopterin synthase catalytic subunit